MKGNRVSSPPIGPLKQAVPIPLQCIPVLSFRLQTVVIYGSIRSIRDGSRIRHVGENPKHVVN